MSTRSRWVCGATVVVLGLVGVAIWAVYDVGNVEKRVSQLERELSRRDSIPRIQAWLASLGPQSITPSVERDRKQWPECLRELRTIRMRSAENGGVWLHLVTGLDLEVFPMGRRPARQLRERSGLTAPYVGTYGPDAYISAVER